MVSPIQFDCRHSSYKFTNDVYCPYCYKNSHAYEVLFNIYYYAFPPKNPLCERSRHEPMSRLLIMYYIIGYRLFRTYKVRLAREIVGSRLFGNWSNLEIICYPSELRWSDGSYFE